MMHGIGDAIMSAWVYSLVVAVVLGWLFIEGFIWLICFLYNHLEWVS